MFITSKIYKANIKLERYIKKINIRLFKKRSLERIIQKGDFFNIPIYIISFNRLSYLKQMVNWLHDYGYNNITIIDNNSDYGPLLDYYKTCSCKVIRMKKNYGYKVFNENIRFLIDRHKGYYVLTDPDLSLVKECPKNFIEVFFKILLKNIEYSKVGFSIKIDDIPDSYYLKQQVIEWENKLYQEKVYDNPEAYNAKIDTTFALNSPSFFVSKKERLKGIRVSYPYQVRHLPWYPDLENDNDIYLKTKRNDQTTWNGDNNKETIENWINTHH